MSCFCIDGDFKFKILNEEKDTIWFIDNSDWKDVPEEYILYIKIPGANEYNEITIKTGNYINKITMSQINPLFTNFPDGIYEIKVDICGMEFYNYFLRTLEIDCNLIELGSKICNYELFKKVKMFRDAAHAVVKCSFCSIEQVKEYLEAIKILLKDVECNC